MSEKENKKISKDENIMEKMFGKYIEENLETADERLNSNKEDKILRRDQLIENIKNEADSKKYKNIEFLSIVIPSYNRFDILNEVVKSIHKNADTPFELIIHDDNSKDGTKESLIQLNNKTSAIIYSNGLNLGLAESVNRATRIASSEYILMLNADIVLEKPFFKYLIDVLKCPFVGFVNLSVTNPNAKNKLSIHDKNSFFSLHQGIGAGCAIAFTKAVFNKVGEWNSSSCRTSSADVSFMTKTIKNGYFPVDLCLDTPPVRTLDIDNKKSTIGGVKYDCSYPKIFNYKAYEILSIKRASDANLLMQYNYKTDEGETNIDFWHRFCKELIDDDGKINYELAKRYGHDKWFEDKTSMDTGLIYKIDNKDNNEGFNIKELLVQLFSEYYIVQNFSELRWLAEKVNILKPKIIIEVGVEKGGTLKVWEKLLHQDKNSILIGVDLGNSVSWELKESKVNAHLVKGNSTHFETLNKVKEILNGRKADFVYIDGEHTPNAAMTDFHFYGNLVRPGGLVGFHDIGDVKDFLDTLPQDKLQKFSKNPPFESFGAQMTIGTAVYYV